MLIPVGEITPVSDYGRKDCPAECSECEYFNGLLFGEINCGLEEEESEEED